MSKLVSVCGKFYFQVVNFYDNSFYYCSVMGNIRTALICADTAKGASSKTITAIR